MPFGFGSSRKQNTDLFTTNIKDREELSEITKIADMLNRNEKVLLVARRSGINLEDPPNIVYATDRRIIIRDPHMLGLENLIWLLQIKCVLRTDLQWENMHSYERFII